MKRTLELTKELGVAAGAHPSYPDPANYGRVELEIAVDELEASLRKQIAALARAADKLGVRLNHVKPHGAVYHAANRHHEIALAIGRAVMAGDSNLTRSVYPAGVFSHQVRSGNVKAGTCRDNTSNA